MKSLHLLGPEQAVFTVVEDVLDSPTGFLWKRFQGLRRHLDITIAGIVTGPRTVSVVTVPGLADRHRVRPGRAPRCRPRTWCCSGSPCVSPPTPTTSRTRSPIEALGHDPGTGDPPGFAAVVVTSEAVAEPLKLLLGGHRRPRAADPPVRRRGHRLGERRTPRGRGAVAQAGARCCRGGWSFGPAGGLRLAADRAGARPAGLGDRLGAARRASSSSS